ncbi:hypothetical protein FOYG_16694 [Fusarium oxysporum NRRL 32931]|uniref:Nucleoside phosphorylase domain-containing protein n=1 Tax=Fusarium oxysporum NRRL 32931 TaxID=660029 RepID=W9HIE0_FUSOX|nr:hypothetical protein FOYG_16694 [Fusarium oxysporum NRRL 32931]
MLIQDKLYHHIVQHLETALENCLPNLGLKRQHSMNPEIKSIMEPMNKRIRIIENNADSVHVSDIPGEPSDAYHGLGKDVPFESRPHSDTKAGSFKGEAQPPKDRCGFKAAIICALPLEFDAIRSLFDSIWQEQYHHYGKLKGDTNHYVNGRIGDLDVVVLFLYSMGKVSAGTAAARLQCSYPELEVVFLAGICGGIPEVQSPNGGKREVLLDDVVVSSHMVLPSLICERCRGVSCDEAGCDEKFLVARCRLQEKMLLEEQGDICEAQKPLIFLGQFGSGDTVLKSSKDRDGLAERLGIAAFEMESAGLWEDLPGVVVKGVCDYADSHKNKEWQDFAAATSASVVKALLERYIITDNWIIMI